MVVNLKQGRMAPEAKLRLIGASLTAPVGSIVSWSNCYLDSSRRDQVSILGAICTKSLLEVSYAHRWLENLFTTRDLDVFWGCKVDPLPVRMTSLASFW